MNDTEKKEEHMKQIRQANEAVAAASESAEHDEYRLQYHVMPPGGWMNDPNGLVHFKGEYHLFYQHHPYSDKWGPMHWGHAVSKDLVHWRHLPIALAPTEPYELGESGGYGCWSGSAVEHEGELTLFYTGHVDGRMPAEVQCTASSVDGIVFDKHDGNPVIAGSPDEGNIGFRDPKVWCYEGNWYMIIGSGKAGKGKALLYRSLDLEKWDYMGIAAESDGTQGDMWECPDLFPLGENHVLILSPMNMNGVKNLYMSGEMNYATGTFTPQTQAKLDHGPDFYAAQTLLDDQGRRIMIAWMDRWGSAIAGESHGWYGAMTLPRELVLKSDGTVVQLPVSELKKLRSEAAESVSGLQLEEGRTAIWHIEDGRGFEWIAEFDFEDSAAQRMDISLLVSEEGREETLISYIPGQRRLILDCTRSGRGDVQISEALLPTSTNSRLKLQVFVDRTSVEIFANDGDIVMTSRVYPSALTGGLQIKPEGGAVILQSLKMWSLNRS